MKKVYIFLVITFLTIFTLNRLYIYPFGSKYKTGQAIDSLNHVKVYFNGSVGHVEGRNTKNGYNIGLKYQCVEFVKRYYFKHLNHKMPNSYGHAKSFFNPLIKDGKINKDRNLTQFSNPSVSKPKVNDLIIFDGHLGNKFGHVAIISNVFSNKIEIIQQNAGRYKSSRKIIELKQLINSKWHINNSRVLGWLRK
jgi:surface antigen